MSVRVISDSSPRCTDHPHFVRAFCSELFVLFLLFFFAYATALCIVSVIIIIQYFHVQIIWLCVRTALRMRLNWSLVMGVVFSLAPPVEARSASCKQSQSTQRHACMSQLVLFVCVYV